MTTTPLDEPARPGRSLRARDGAVAGSGDVDTDLTDAERDLGTDRDSPGGAARGDQGTGARSVLHPIRSWEARGRRWLPGVAYPIAVWALWRLAHLLTNLYALRDVPGGSPILTAYNYDGERYLQILHYGYANYTAEMPNTAFFPGISWFAWPVYQVTKSNAWTAHLVASITGLAAFVTIWGVSRAWKSEAVARRAVWLVALMPSSIFLWAFYSEGLFIALGAGAVWADRRDRRGIAAACLFAIATTRSVGVLVPLVLAFARVVRQRRIDPWAVAYASAGVAGVLPVLYMQHHYTGDWFAFMRVQDDWGRGLSWPWATIRQGFDNLWPTPDTIMVPALVARNFDVWCVPIVFVGLGYLAFSRKDRFPMEAWMIGVALVALPLSSTSLASFNRFVFATWVIYPAYASLAGRLPPWVRRAFWAVTTVSLVIVSYHFIGRYSAERFVG